MGKKSLSLRAACVGYHWGMGPMDSIAAALGTGPKTVDGQQHLPYLPEL
jgi:hypothetical protein